jgi:6-phosphofructokinase 1
MDRVRAVRFAVRSLQHLEKYAGKSQTEIGNTPEACALIGIRGAKVCLTPMQKIETEETDWKHRRPKEEYWHSLTGLGDVLAGRPRSSEAPAEIKVMPC